MSVPSLLSPLLLLPACGEDPGARDAVPAKDPTLRPAPTDRLLEVDGLVVSFGDLEPFVAYLDALYPRSSYKSKLRMVLDAHWLPVLLARRAFPERREELERQAGNLADVADNVHDLQARGAVLGGRRSERPLARTDVELPVAAWLFDPARIGQVSGALEVPQGFKVVAAYDSIQSDLAVDDRVDAFQVPFFTHDMKTFVDWLDVEKERVANKVTHVHPEFTDVLPRWLKAP